MTTWDPPKEDDYVPTQVIIDPVLARPVLHVGHRPYVAADGLPYFTHGDIINAADLNLIVDRIRKVGTHAR